MSMLADIIAAAPAESLTGAGLVIGGLFGATLRSSNFCVMGAIADWRLFGSHQRLLSVVIAMAVAIVGTQLLHVSGVTNLTESIYLKGPVNWLGAIIGGLGFGIGMVFAGGCPSTALIRAGRGDARAGIVLIVMAIAAYATLSGIFGQLRVSVTTATAISGQVFGLPTASLDSVVQSVGRMAGPGAELSSEVSRSIATLVLVATLMIYISGQRSDIKGMATIATGMIVGCLVVAAWAVTGMGFDEMTVQPLSPQSLSFVRPVADAIDWVERSTALGWPGFAVASVFGTVLGSAIVSFAIGGFGFAGFVDAADLRRHLSGAALMGVGGILAMGCTIGQGLTGVSTLALQSLLATMAIFAGGVIGLRLLERGGAHEINR